MGKGPLDCSPCAAHLDADEGGQLGARLHVQDVAAIRQQQQQPLLVLL